MRINLISMWYNEEFLAPFFLNHYKWVDKIHLIIDSDTNDNTLEIIRSYNNVEIEFFKFPDMMDDKLKVNKINNVYCSIFDADYVIVVDSDEFIFCNDPHKSVKDHISQTMKDIYFVNFWQIYKHEDDNPLDPTIPVYEQRLHGDPNMDDPFNVLYVKPIVVKAGKNIYWGVGNHEVIYDNRNFLWRDRDIESMNQKNIASNQKDMLQGSHWKLVDLDQTITRRITNRKNRQSKVNLAEGLTYQYHSITEADIIKEYESNKKQPIVVKNYDQCDYMVEKIKENYFSHVRPEIIAEVPKEALTVLDIGCGAGKLGERLKVENSLRSVVGIELNDKACRAASLLLDRVYCTGVEEFDPPFAPSQFDCIICADILEHLVDPWKVIEKYLTFLKPGGTFIASLPNIRNINIISRLLHDGEWEYQDEGILDRTHLRFFTRSQFLKYIEQEGLVCDRITLLGCEARNFDLIEDSLTFENITMDHFSPEQAAELFAIQIVYTCKKQPSSLIPRQIETKCLFEMNPRTFSNEGICFGEGFYDEHEKSRWIAPIGKLYIASRLLTKRLSVSFVLSCHKLHELRNPPLTMSIYLDDVCLGTHVFSHDHEQKSVNILLNPAKKYACIRIESSTCFAPSDNGSSPDSRHLSLLFNHLTIQTLE